MPEKSFVSGFSKFLVFPVFLIFFVVFCFYNLGSYGLIDWDENIYAELSRQMILRNNYLNMFINDQAFAEKPPLFFWIMASGFKVFGVGEISARLPAVLSGIIIFIAVYFCGKKISGKRFGLIWAVISGFSLAPALLSRTAIIDQMFNMFIALSVIGFAFFENALREERKKDQWLWLFIVSLTMGLGVLTKGPLGGAVPVFSYAFYKIFHREKMFGFSQFAFCGALSLSIPAFWVLANVSGYGTNFLADFWNFQVKLFSQSLEGHKGPFFFHFIVVFAGLLPWSALLFICPFREIFRQNNLAKVYALLALPAVLIVLLIMSLVKTKLAHYSSPVYIPLSFFCAVGFDKFMKESLKTALFKKIFFALIWFLLPALLFVLPMLLDKVLTDMALPKTELNTPAYFGLAGMALLGFAVTFFLFNRNSVRLALAGFCLSMFLAMNVFYAFVLPEYDRLIQKPLTEKIDEYLAKDGEIVFYGMLSFRAFFYNQAKVNIIGSYKFKGDESVLEKPVEKDSYVFVPPDKVDEFEKKYPELPRVESNPLFTVYLKKESVS